LIQSESLSSKSVVEFLKKYDNNASFRNDLLHMSPKDFKETVITEVFKGLKEHVDELDKEEKPLVARYKQLIEA